MVILQFDFFTIGGLFLVCAVVITARAGRKSDNLATIAWLILIFGSWVYLIFLILDILHAPAPPERVSCIPVTAFFCKKYSDFPGWSRIACAIARVLCAKPRQ